MYVEPVIVQAASATGVSHPVELKVVFVRLA